ncbi:MAG TPA: response regulator transcription factor [Frankiaceae bacterium]|nr:response regulator transcription factor [Frankiaceae bacterium]
MGSPDRDAVRPLGVLIVDDHGVVRRGLRAYLAEIDEVVVRGEAADGRRALDRLEELRAAGRLPDVVLMDLMMPGMDGIAATAAVRARFPEVEVVALTTFVDEGLVQRALRAGATGYLLKDAEPDEVVAAIRAAAHGRMHLDPAAARRLASSLQAPPLASVGPQLTDRERQVLGLVAQGRSNREIAAVLVLSERTVRSHVSAILGKLGLSSRTQAALWAVREGLAPPSGAPHP